MLQEEQPTQEENQSDGHTYFLHFSCPNSFSAMI